MVALFYLVTGPKLVAWLYEEADYSYLTRVCICVWVTVKYILLFAVIGVVVYLFLTGIV